MADIRNPVAEDEARRAMKEAANEQGGTAREGTSEDPARHAGAPPEFSRSGGE